MIDRHAFRAHALDGAALYFQPATGVHVRIAHASTRPLRRRAPRVAMFGITNACNLHCDFCSRDVARPSRWTVASAAAALRGLHDAGTLEVAYGGGEPFAFRGFAELVAELDATTALAQHVTTNGTLIDAATWPAFAGRFGVVRMSIYDDGWRAPAGVLADHGQRWGANLLVDAAALPGLPARLTALAAAGCHDVSLLSYVGPDAARHLDDAGARALAAIAADSPLPCRLSVCFGDRVPAPRLFADGDCGAGRDFVSITPDQRVQGCSFQDGGAPAATADEILAAWRTQQPRLAQPATRRGCARLVPLRTVPREPPPITIWRGFSGNNSGECVLVATFTAIADAEAYLAELAPGWARDAPHSEAWRRLFVDEGVMAPGTPPSGEDDSPRELLAIGRTVIGLQVAPDDAFGPLRALAWKRGAQVAPGGVHVHEPLTLVAAIATTGDDDRGRVLAAGPAGARTYPHGDRVLVTIPLAADDRAGNDLAAARDALLALAGPRRFTAAIHGDAIDEATLIAAKQRLGHPPPSTPRLIAGFWGRGDEAAARFAATVGARATVAGPSVLVDPAPDRKRLAVLAYRQGATVDVLDDTRVKVDAMIWYDPPPPQKGTRAPARVVDCDAVEAHLRGALAREAALAVIPPEPRGWQRGPRIAIETDHPTAALAALVACAAAIDARLHAGVADRDPLGATLRRVLG